MRSMISETNENINSILHPSGWPKFWADNACVGTSEVSFR